VNIFYLDHDPAVAAMYQHDKHVVKMCLETAQILCTVQHRYGRTAPYKPTHANHPSVLWAGDCVLNYRWLVKHGEALCAEYAHRYGKEHACREIIKQVWVAPLALTERVRRQTMPPQCMPDEYKVPGQTVLAYRNYYLGAKVANQNWTRRARPNFVIQGESKMAKKKAAPAEVTEQTVLDAGSHPAPEAAEPVARTRGPRGVSETAVITVLADKNPKRVGSKASDLWEKYSNGMTVAQYVDATGKDATPALVYDAAHGFIAIEGYTPGVVFTPKVREPKAPKEPKAKKPKAVKDAEAAVDADLGYTEEA